MIGETHTKYRVVCIDFRKNEDIVLEGLDMTNLK